MIVWSKLCDWRCQKSAFRRKLNETIESGTASVPLNGMLAKSLVLEIFNVARKKENGFLSEDQISAVESQKYCSPHPFSITNSHS